MSDNLQKHPGYGMLGFHRTNGNGVSLFGSSIKHNNTIIMTLKHGAYERDLNNDYYSSCGIIAEVEMSYSQFTEAITAMNVGDGIPCTIRYTEKDGSIEDVPFENKQEQFQQEFSEHLNEIMQEVKGTISEAEEILTKKSIGKKDKETILKKLDRLSMQISTNTEFVYKQFNEQIDKTVMEAKGEVEAFCQNKINSIAMATMVREKENFKAIENPINIQ